MRVLSGVIGVLRDRIVACGDERSALFIVAERGEKRAGLLVVFGKVGVRRDRVVARRGERRAVLVIAERFERRGGRGRVAAAHELHGCLVVIGAAAGHSQHKSGGEKYQSQFFDRLFHSFFLLPIRFCRRSYKTNIASILSVCKEKNARRAAHFAVKR